MALFGFLLGLLLHGFLALSAGVLDSLLDLFGDFGSKFSFDLSLESFDLVSSLSDHLLWFSGWWSLVVLALRWGALGFGALTVDLQADFDDILLGDIAILDLLAESLLDLTFDFLPDLFGFTISVRALSLLALGSWTILLLGKSLLALSLTFS